MKEKTALVFDRLETQRSEIVERYNHFTPEQLRYKPAPDQWNLLQVMRHLVTAEKQSMIYIQRKIANQNNVPKAGAGSFFRHSILRLALFLPIKFKAPKIAEVKEEYPDLNQMINEWAVIRGEIKSLIDNSDEKTLAKALYRHPRAGMLNIKQALEFIEVHINHHQKQMDRLIRRG